ncbi:MAG: response regulator [Phormidesmis sp. CAN_BIN36]|nr:response regulator [Phormidesmis sp. CAN_BIN36]
MSLSGIRILVVDDDTDSRDFITFVLEQEGAEITVASSAVEAFGALSRCQPDLLISDIGMPEIDGYMLMQQVRSWSLERGGQIPAIAPTAYAGENDQQQALSAGFQAYMSKPAEPDQLVAIAIQLVGK